MSNRSASSIVEQARRWKGVKEVGANAAFNNEEFQALMSLHGWRSGEPWCASFARMVWMEAYSGHTMRALVARILTKSVVLTWRNAKASDKIVCRDLPTIGGLICWSTGGGKGHMGIVTEIVDAMNVWTIEGNTSRLGGREGDSVMRKRRTLNSSTLTDTARRVGRAGSWQYLGCIYPPGIDLIPFAEESIE